MSSDPIVNGTALPTRLPGVYFLPPPQGAPLGLPPLDVAAFVGFAERGPVDLPVALEDVAQYEAVFGGDLALARDEQGRIVYANLPSAVRSYFANGGRRCYVVRVAGRRARRARFALAGMIGLDGAGFARQALINASTEGRWSNRLRLAARLAATPLPSTAFEGGLTELRWSAGSSPFSIVEGDLLRLTGADGRQWLFPIDSIQRPPDQAAQVILHSSGAFELSRLVAGLPIPIESVFRLGAGDPVPLLLAGTIGRNGAVHVAELQGPDATELRPGDILELELAGKRLLFPIVELRERTGQGSPPEPAIEARGGRLLRLPAGPFPVLPPGHRFERVERLRFDLLSQLGGSRRPDVTDLAFNRGGPRFWGDVALVESSALFRASQASRPTAGLTNESSPSLEWVIRAADQFRLHRQQRRVEDRLETGLDVVALAGLLSPLDQSSPPDGQELDFPTLRYLPLDLPSVVDDEDLQSPLEVGSDDLERYLAEPFLDPLLSGVAANRLLDEATERAYVQGESLRGLHSLLTVDEVAMVSIPDSVHRAWRPLDPPVPPPQPPLSLRPAEDLCPDLVSPFAACDRPAAVETVNPSFGPVSGDTPVVIDGGGFGDGPIDVRFGRHSAAGVVVESDTRLRCLSAAGSAAGPVDIEVANRVGSGRLADSFIYVASPSPADLPELVPVAEFELAAGPLLEIQQAVSRVCQARRDLVGLLSLPGHFGRRECLDWHDAFRQRLGLPRRGRASDLADLADLSFVAVYHPWALLADRSAPDGTRAVPPDGVVAGMIATRERRRGVWIAPANQPLEGALGVVPDLSPDDWAALFEAQLNLLRREAADVRVMSAHTLSDEQALQQLSVRRLMILLRKAVAEHGMDFVFETNHERFRDGVAALLRTLLNRLFERGAFAGSSREQAFRVVTGPTVNPPVSVDQGQFVALIQVAPSQPAEFITVTLTRSEEAGLQATEV